MKKIRVPEADGILIKLDNYSKLTLVDILQKNQRFHPLVAGILWLVYIL